MIYQYFGDKDDVLFLSLKLVLETYEHEIPPRLEGIEHPVDRLCMALWAYCTIVDGLREATILAYRSTQSLRADRRALVKEDEARTNRLIEACLHACVAGGYMRKVNEYLLAYQTVMFAHAWALKNWAFRDKYSLAKYVAEGIALLVEPFLTARGRAALDNMKRRTGNFSHEARDALRKPRAALRSGSAGANK